MLHGALLEYTSTVNFHIEGKDADILLLRFDMANICISSGTACASGERKPTRILKAMGYSDRIAANSLRVSFGEESTAALGVSVVDRNTYTLPVDVQIDTGKVGGPFAGAPMLLLTHTGAKSGKVRTTPLVCTNDNDDMIIIASKSGAPEHPAWYHNLVVNPAVTVEVGTDRFDAIAVEVAGDDRQR